jgi:DnaJ-class molecular chaperone
MGAVERCPRAKSYNVQVGKSDKHVKKYICKITCELCHGIGKLITCPTCDGAGLKVGGVRCETCGTRGKVPATA